MKIISLFILLLVTAGAFAQTRMDTLSAIENSTAHDSVKAWHYRNHAVNLSNEFPDSAIKVAKMAIQLTRKNHQWGVTGECFYFMAMIEAHRNHYGPAELLNDSAYFYYNKGKSPALIKSIELRGNIYLSTGRYSLAAEAYMTQLSTMEDDDEVRLLYIYNNLILLLNNIGKTNEALSYCHKAYKIAAGLKNETEIGWACMNFADTYNRIYQTDSARPYVLQGYDLAQASNDSGLIASAASLMGSLKMGEGDFQASIKFYKEALNISQRTNDGMSMCNALNALANANLKLNRPYEASEYLHHALKLAGDMQLREQRKDTYELLSQNAVLQNNYKDAYRYTRLMVDLSDSLLNEKSQSDIMDLQEKYKLEQKQKEIEIQALKMKEQQATISKQALTRNLLIVIIALVVIISLLLVNRNRQKQNRRRLEERERLSRDLHDHVGSSLGSIANFSEIAKTRAAAFTTEESQHLMEKIVTTSRETIENMSDIVWAINPKNDSMEQVLTRMENTAADVLAPKGIEFNFSVKEDVKYLNLSSEQRKCLFLVFKEAMYNAVKYAGCTDMEIRLERKDKALHLRVTDNGKGFNTSQYYTQNGNGLRNMDARAKEVNGQLQIDSSASGTAINLAIPLR